MTFSMGIFSTSKKNKKSTDKTLKEGIRSCILSEQRKLEKRTKRDLVGKIHEVRWSNKDPVVDKAFTYTQEHYELIAQRKHDHENLNLDKNWCIAQLHAALSPETHLYQVELEKDNAFGLGLYLYGLGPDRLFPYVSIFVKDVIKGGYVDRQGIIKPHDQIIKCGKASFVGIKQEEALRLMKNQPHLQLTMGRRTRADNAPISKKDHKDILSQVGRNWLDPKKGAAAMENGDFRLIKDKDRIDPFFTCTNASPKKTIQIDTHDLARVSGSRNTQSVEDGTPNLKNFIQNRQDFLEDELMKERENSRRERELREKVERQLQETLDQFRKLKHQKDFASEEARYANLKIGELAQENTQLRLDQVSTGTGVWEDRPELAARTAAADLESLLNGTDDTVSVSTFRTAEPMIYNSPLRSHGFREMEILSSENLERSTEMKRTEEGQYVDIITPSHSEAGSRFSYPSCHSNYSSRRQSGQSVQLSAGGTGSHLSSIISLNSAFSYISNTSEEIDPDQTPVNRMLDPRLLSAIVDDGYVEVVDDGCGDMSQHSMFADHQDLEEDFMSGSPDTSESGSLRENHTFCV